MKLQPLPTFIRKNFCPGVCGVVFGCLNVCCFTAKVSKMPRTCSNGGHTMSFSDVPEKRRNSFQDVSGRKNSQFHGLLLDETQRSRPSRPPLCRSCRRCRSEHCLQICFHFGCWAILFVWVGMQTPHLVTVGKWRFRLGSPILKNCCNPGGAC